MTNTKVKIKILVIAEEPINFESEDGYSVARALESISLFCTRFITFDVYKEKLESYLSDEQAQRIKERVGEADVIMLFGYRANQDHMRENQVQESPFNKVIWEAMKEGKGVFACGDHETRGQWLCGSIPIVQDLQLWDEPVPTTARSGEYVNDTILRPDFWLYSGFDSYHHQSDNIPTELFPHYSAYFHPFHKLYPYVHNVHPVLSLPVLLRGKPVLKKFPDHMHEGEVVLPNEARIREATIDGEFVYPCSEPGFLAPYALAGIDSKKYEILGENLKLTKRRFLCLGGFDGFPCKRGRVLVDSSFHHWVHVNLTGELDPPGREVTLEYRSEYKARFGKAIFNGLAEEDFLEISNYFLNTVLWLAPRAKQIEMAVRGLHWAVEEVRKGRHTNPTAAHPLDVGNAVLKVAQSEIGHGLVHQWWTFLFEGDLSAAIQAQWQSERADLDCLNEYMTGFICKALVGLEAGADNLIDSAKRACDGGIRTLDELLT